MAKPVEPNFTPARPFDPFAPEEEVLRSVAVKEEQSGLKKSYIDLYDKKKNLIRLLLHCKLLLFKLLIMK